MGNSREKLSAWWQYHLPKMTLLMLSAMIAAMVYLFVQTAATERRAR